jgi:NO-binding membrane sensor protein with MHYT domain
MVIPPNQPLPGSYDALEVALSILIAVAASYAALDLAGRVAATRGRAHLIWLTGGAVSMGLGIWDMHYVGLYAFRLPVRVSYHWPTVLLSFVVAILWSAFALKVVSRRRMDISYALIGSVILGAGIAGHHYITPEAMRFPGECHFNIAMVVLSILLAIGFSLAALWFGFYFRYESKEMDWRKLGSAGLMGSAFSAMHYTGMSATTFLSSPSPPNLVHTMSMSSFGTVGIGILTLAILGLTALTCAVDRRFDAKDLELALAQTRVQLAHAGRVGMLGELAASIVHEVNQPLSAITLNTGAALSWLNIEPPNLEEAKKAITRALQEARRATEIISRIRAMLKRASPQIALVNMNEVVGEALSVVASEITKTGVTAKTELTPNAAYVRADRIELQQVLLNLIMNAVQAMSKANHHDRELLIRTANENSSVMVQVEDSGPGLNAFEAERVFEPFYTTKSQGLGMGLSISRSIIEKYGGHLSARPRNSRGAIFEFALPAAVQNERSEKGDSGEHAAQARLKKTF